MESKQIVKRQESKQENAEWNGRNASGKLAAAHSSAAKVLNAISVFEPLGLSVTFRITTSEYRRASLLRRSVVIDEVV